jgi:uncharacterized protein (TIGR03032 family)
MKAEARGAMAGGASPRFELTASRQFPNWLAEQGCSLAFTTYQAGKLFLIGLQPDGRLSVFERTLNRCLGLAAEGDSLYVSSLYQLWRFENLFEPGQSADGYDRMYVPQVGWVTGDLDVHDLALDAKGRLIFVNTLFSCLARISETHSFEPFWRPPFISKLAAEDRCHLNGLAIRAGRPAYVTSVSESDVGDGWRDKRVDGGCVIDIQANEVILRGLSMPHSPRWHRRQLWLHNSGTGEFGTVDLKAGRFEPVCFCAGYLRGLAFIGDYAVIGTSLSRENKTFQGLPLDDRLQEKMAEPRCGLQVVDLRSGDCVHWLRLEGVVRELYDVAVLPGCQRPMAIGFQSDEIRRVISVGGEGAST